MGNKKVVYVSLGEDYNSQIFPVGDRFRALDKLVDAIISCERVDAKPLFGWNGRSAEDPALCINVTPDHYERLVDAIEDTKYLTIRSRDEFLPAEPIPLPTSLDL